MEVGVKENDLAEATDPVIRVEAVASKVIAGQQTAGFRLVANNSLTSILPVKYGVYRGSDTTNFMQAFPSNLEIATTNILTGQTTATIQVPTFSGSDQVAKESIMQVFLLDGTNYAVIADGQGESATVTISNELDVTIAPKLPQVTEGNMAEFVISTSRAITRSLMVNVKVTQSGDYLSTGALAKTQVLLDPTKSTNGTDFNISLATRANDNTLTSPGTVNMEVFAGTNYFVGSDSIATLSVHDASSNTKPVISISRESIEVEEGDDAVFMLQADIAPGSEITVMIGITQTGDFVSNTTNRPVKISTMQPVKLEIATTADAADEVNGSVTARILDDSAPVSYTAGTIRTQTITIIDNDHPGLPTATISGPNEIEEGHVAVYTLTLDPIPSKVVIAKYSITVVGTFFDSSISSILDDVVVLINGTGTFEIPTLFDDDVEANGRITAVIREDDNNPPQYSVGTNFKASTIVKDNDFTGKPKVTIARTTISTVINESAGTLGHTITADATPASNTKVRVMLSQEGDFITIPSNGIQEYDLATSVPITTTINSDTMDEPDGSVTLTVLSDTNDPPRYSVGSEATVTTIIMDDDPTPAAIPMVYFDTSLSDTGVSIFKPFELTVRSMAPVSENLVIRYYISRAGAPSINGGTNNQWSIAIPKGQSSATVVHTINADNSNGLSGSPKYTFLIQDSTKYTNIQSQYSSNNFMEVGVKINNPATATLPVVSVEAIQSQVNAGESYAWFRIATSKILTSTLPIKVSRISRC